MALNKTIKSRAGFDMSYWKITDWHVTIGQNTMSIDLTPYVSQETRIENLEPVYDERRKIRVFGEDYTNYFSPAALETSPDDIYKIMYRYIKEKVAEFEGATDI